MGLNVFHHYIGGGNSNILNFHPETWGRFPSWRKYFSDGLKPPTWLLVGHDPIWQVCFSIVRFQPPPSVNQFDHILQKKGASANHLNHISFFRQESKPINMANQPTPPNVPPLRNKNKALIGPPMVNMPTNDIDLPRRKFIFRPWIFRGHVSFREGKKKITNLENQVTPPATTRLVRLFFWVKQPIFRGVSC